MAISHGGTRNSAFSCSDRLARARRTAGRFFACVTLAALVSVLMSLLSTPAAGANPPLNDGPNSATPVSGFATVHGSNVESAGAETEPENCSAPDTTVWFSWTAPTNGTVRVTTAGSNFDTVLGIYTATNQLNFATYTLVGCNDDVEPGIFTSRLDVDASAGTTYLFQVDGYGETVGDITLTVSQAFCTAIGSAAVSTPNALMQGDCDALVDLYRATGGPDWTANAGWASIDDGGTTDPAPGPA